MALIAPRGAWWSRGTRQKQAKRCHFQFMCKIADTVTSPKMRWSSGGCFTGWVLNAIQVISSTSGLRTQPPVHDCFDDKQKYIQATRGMQANPVPGIFRWAVSFHPGRGERSGNSSISSISQRWLKSTQVCSGFGPNRDHSGFRVIKFGSWRDVCCLRDSWDKK